MVARRITSASCQACHQQVNAGTAKAEGEFEIVELERALNFAFSFGLNSQGILNCCLRTQFTILKDIFAVEADALLRRLEQFGDF